MDTSIKITLAYLPEEGQSFRGELDKSALATTEADLVQPHTAFHYDIHVQRFDDELLVRGYLETTMQMTCVRSDHHFLQTFAVEEFAASVEIDAGTIDLTDALREELFIQLPTNPTCDDGDENIPCKIDSEYLAVDKPTETSVNEPPAADGEKKWSSNWDALNSMNDFSDKKENN